jgi:hypothetical protein
MTSPLRGAPDTGGEAARPLVVRRQLRFSARMLR